MEAVNWINNFPVFEYTNQFAQDFTASILRTGPIPRHVAFVMDGNRRFARNNGLESGEGHFIGFETLLSVLRACAKLGVSVVTTYAFSIENFNRKKEEADLLFNMIRTKVWELVENENSLAHRAGWKIKVWGNMSLLEPDIAERIKLIEELTKDNTTMTINICCPYTSRDDITQATRKLVNQVEERKLAPDQVDLAHFRDALYIGDKVPLDILIRTSGEARLSDFMCWESVENCQVTFVTSLWPDFSAWEFYGIVLRWSYRKAIASRRTPIDLQELRPAPPTVEVHNAKSRN